MLNRLSMLLNLASHEWFVWALLGTESIIVVAVALSAFAQRAKLTLTTRGRRGQCSAFFEQLATGLRMADRAGDGSSRASVQRCAVSLLSLLPRGPLGAFVAWRTTHLATSTAVEQKIALLIAQAEGCSGRLLDFAKVTSPLLGLAGTLMGLQHAFSQAHLGKAAVEAGLATALYTTYAGILIAIAAFSALRFLVEPILGRLEAELWEAESKLGEIYASAEERADGQIAAGQEPAAPLRGRADPGIPHRPSTMDKQWWDATATDGEDPFAREPLDG